MAKLIKVVRVRGNLEAKVQGGRDGKLFIYKEGNDIILFLKGAELDYIIRPRITYDNTPLSEINTVIAKYLGGPQNFQVIQDPFDPNVIPFQEITPEPPTPAPTPQQIEQTRQEEASARQQAQENTQLQQTDSTIVEQSTPEALKPKGKAKLGQRVLNLGKQTIKLILPKLTSLAKEYAISEFETAQAEATTPEQIDALKQRFCPSPDQLQRLIDTRNNIVGQLNSIGTKLSTLNFSIGGLQDVTSTLKSLLSSVETAKLATSAAAKLVPAIPGAVPALLSDLETIDDKVLPLLEKNSGSINATAVPTAVVTSIINKIVNALGQLDSLILLCSPNSTLDTISDTIIQTANNQNQADINDGSYKGFTFQIEEVPFSPTVNRRKAIALNQQGIPVLESELSFTTNNQTLINELKLVIDRDNLKAF
jgi:hypothetical protein